MLLLSMYKFVRDNLTVFFLGTLAFILVMLPLIKNSFNGVFYIVDPDAVYVGNAVSYIKVGQISYVDHPGTPSIQMLSLALAPVRLYSKYVKNQTFLTTVVGHYKFIFTYLRLFQSLLMSVGLLILLYSIRSFTKSDGAVFFGWAYLLSFSAFPYFGLSISAEAFNILILCIWSAALLAFAKYKSPIILVFLCFTAGVALSNRLTNFFTVFATLGLTNYLILSNTHKIRNLLINSLVVACGFVAGTMPISSKYSVLFGWIIRLATTPKLHGGGQGFFDASLYINSITTVLNSNPEILFFGAIGALIMLIICIKEKLISIEMFLMATAVMGVIIFSKYPLTHYQTANIFMMMVSIVIFLNKHKGIFKYSILSLILLIFVVPKNINSYYLNIEQAMIESSAIDKKASEMHENGKATIWEWSVSRDFSLLWGNSWTGNSYQPELTTVRPDIYQLSTDMHSYKDHNGQDKPLFDMCWRNLFIQTSELNRFLSLNAVRAFSIRKIANTRMSIVTSNHCATTP